MLHSYGKPGDNSMFGELVFHPAGPGDVAVEYRSWSADNGVVYEQALSPGDLGIGP